MQQFFTTDINSVSLNEEQIHQCKKVLRMKKGDQIRVVDKHGNGAIFTFLDNELEKLSYVEKLRFPTKKYKLRLITSMIRNERLEWLIQKAAETGVDEIFLYSADHAVVRDYGKRSQRKLARFQKIALEASEQSYRQFPLLVHGIINKTDLLDLRLDKNYYLDIGDHPHLFEKDEDYFEECIIIGPEGGFSDDERLIFENSGFQARSLGKNILRAETANIVAAAFVSLKGEL